MAYKSVITNAVMPGTESIVNVDRGKPYTMDEIIKLTTTTNDLISYLNTYIPALERYLGTYHGNNQGQQ